MIRVLAATDVREIASRFHLQYSRQLEDGDHEGLRVLPLREEGATLPILKGEKGWPSMRSFLVRLKNQAALFFAGPAEIGRVWIEQLDPKAHVPWSVGLPSEWSHVRVCLYQPVASILYSGGEPLSMIPGTVAHMKRDVLHSWVNLGDWPAVHLCAELRKAEAELDD